VTCSVPQGPVLGPVLFLLYSAELQDIIIRHALRPHLYADDTQMYGSCRPNDIDQLKDRVSTCVDEIASLMRANRLQLRTTKTDVIWFATNRRQSQLPSTGLRIGNDVIIPSKSVRDLGVHLDSHLTMKTHVN
jgi:Reverse transcriptase (RNA-dependent DNA polymerase)